MSIFYYLQRPHLLKFHHGIPDSNRPFGIMVAHESHRDYGENNLFGISLGSQSEQVDIRLFGHDAIEVSLTLQRFIQPATVSLTYLTASQRRGVYTYLSLIDPLVELAEDVDLIMRYYNTFNDIFFLGALENLCAVEFYDLSTNIRGKTYYGPREEIPIDKACLIRLRPKMNDTPPTGIAERLNRYVQTLLHEMLHAFFDVYTCRQCKKCKKISKGVERLGKSGHGNAWQDAALAIESASTILFGQTLDMGRNNGFAKEWSRHEDSPSLQLMNSLNFEKSHTLRNIDRHKSRRSQGQAT